MKLGQRVKHTLKYFHITSTVDCLCDLNAQILDRKDKPWVKKNMSTVLGWFQKGAENRGMLGYFLVKKHPLSLCLWTFGIKTAAWLLIQYAMWRTDETSS